jgi:hypothetical protein
LNAYSLAQYSDATPIFPSSVIAPRQRASNLRKIGYLAPMKPVLQPRPIDPEKLKPALHDKIERMDGLHLSVLNRVPK